MSSDSTKKEKKPYPIMHVVNWYYGNFCTRKCFNKEERLFECWNKLQEFASTNNSLKIRHKEFKDLLDNDHIKICLLKPNFRKRTVGWTQMERWQRESDFDPDKFD
ncbi:MAG: hypothetical protein V1866_02305 [archaeon]